MKFSGSPEAKQLKQYDKLKANNKLQTYYQLKESGDIEKYQELKDSETVKRYQELVQYVRSKYKADRSAFKKKMKKDPSLKFEDSDASKKYSELQKLKASSDIKFFFEFPKSRNYRTYKKVADSSLPKNFEELKNTIESEEFKERKVYLEDKQRWEKTEAYQKEQDYNKMKSDPLFINYLKYKKSNAFDFFRNWNLVFEDRFEGQTLNTEKWQTITSAAQKTIGKNFSQPEDLQSYTNGENIKVKNNHLQLQVKKEKTETMVWNPASGFVSTEMDYSAGLLTTGEIFTPQYGILEAKIKFSPNKHIEDVFCLTDNKNEYRINLLECGKVNRLGLSSKNSSANESLSGLDSENFYIFKVEWSESKISWKINNQEILSTTAHINTPLSIHLSNIVIEPLAQTSHQFEVDWIRFFQKN